MAGILASTQTITAANSTFVLAVPAMGLTFSLQQVSAGRMFDIDDFQLSETRVGVDGYLAAGYTPQPIVQTISLEANSLSRPMIASIAEYVKMQREIVYVEGVITLPAIKTIYTMTRGVFSRLTPMVGAGTVLNPTTFQIIWEQVVPSTYA